MSDVSVFFCAMSDRVRFRAREQLQQKCMTAVVSDSPLMRCAPHSALIWSQGTPHTFSV